MRLAPALNPTQSLQLSGKTTGAWAPQLAAASSSDLMQLFKTANLGSQFSYSATIQSGIPLYVLPSGSFTTNLDQYSLQFSALVSGSSCSCGSAVASIALHRLS